MPCYDPPWDSPGYIPDTKIVNKTNYSEVRKLGNLLCEATKHLIKHNLMKETSGELQKWSKNHEEEDRIRENRIKEKEANERIKQRALRKLTSDELKALGLTKK